MDERPPTEGEQPATGGGPLLRPGTVTSIGSLPHRDPDAAAVFVLRHQPALPAAPQLPGRSPLEGMIAQVARGIPGVDIDAGGGLVVDASRLDPAAPVDARIDAAGHAGLLGFLTHVAGRREPIKVQLTGPITLGGALMAAGVAPDLAFAVASAAIRAKAQGLVDVCRRRVPDAPLVAFLDEPGLCAVGRPDFPLDPDDTIDLMSGALAVLEPAAVTGIHCCAPADWRLLSAAGATIVSLPATVECALLGASALASHLDRGGWVAWGAVPTDGPVGTDVDRLWRHLSELWCDLVRQGCDPVQLRTQALITPACGLAGHGTSQASRTLRLVDGLARRVSDQAVAARLNVGA